MLDDFSLDYPCKYDSCVMAVYSEHGPGNQRINVGHTRIELSRLFASSSNMEGTFQLK